MKLPPDMEAKILAMSGQAPPRFAGRILAIDGSSTATGWAVVDANRTLAASGVAKPKGRKGPYERIEIMAGAIKDIAVEYLPDALVCEVTSGLCYHKSRASSLAMLSFAQGAYWQRLHDAGWRVELITELQWTARTKKEVRAKRIVEEFPQYSTDRDKGLDEADAIGIALWWQEHSQAKAKGA